MSDPERDLEDAEAKIGRLIEARRLHCRCDDPDRTVRRRTHSPHRSPGGRK